MPILTLQRRMHEAGRIRLGDTVPTKSGKTRPRKLQTFRFTSSDKRKIESLANLYRGNVEPWDNRGLAQWQVTTNVSELPVIVPPTDMAFSQWFELWSAGGCQRRCDGVTEQLEERPCVCDPDDRECKATTRLSLMLAQQQGMGLWRLETHGWNAAAELEGAVSTIQAAAGRGHLLPATLRVEWRRKVIETDKGPQTAEFAVPILDVDLPLLAIAERTSAALGDGTLQPSVALPGASVQQLEHATPTEPAPFTPIPASTPTRDAGSVAEQAARHQQQADAGPKRTKRSAAPIPATGKRPRTVNEAPPPSDEPVVSSKPSQAQIRKLMATANDARLDDDAVHDVIRMVTNSRTQSRKDITRPEFDQALVACELIAGRYVDLVYDENGGLTLVFNETSKPFKWPTDVDAVRKRMAESPEPVQGELDTEEDDA